MSYTIHLDKNVSDEIRRIACERIDKVIKHLKKVDEDPNERIHKARKSLKKLRAVVRLVRDEVGNATYKRENVCYRDAGRALSGARDTFVQINTVQALHEQYADQLADDAFDTVEARLRERHAAELEETVDSPDGDSDTVDVEAVLNELHTARTRIKKWPIDSEEDNAENFALLRPSLKRVYRRGRKMYKKARKKPTTENLHEWRKRAKYLRYQVDLLERVWPNVMDELEETLHDLTDALGDDHDLAILRQLLIDQPELCRDETQQQALLGLIDQRRGELQAEAWPLGQRIYAEKPKAFVKRMATYWKAAAADE